ncbi:MAG TPA: DUF1573 domain-containing protein, partial [Phycisphaerae bacterium]|nr:DUF1573 domain-containing protein [Phycisphaerae bacterium]
MQASRIIVFGIINGLALGGCDKRSPNGNPGQSSGTKSTVPVTPPANMNSTATPPATSVPPTAPPSTPAGNTKAKPGPRWACDEQIHNFGEVWTGKLIIHSFSIRNDGDAPLTISKPKAYCSCSSADSYPSVIEPGKGGSLIYRLDMRNKAGPVHENLEMQTNDPAMPITKVEMIGFAKTVCELAVTEDQAASEGRMPPDRMAKLPTLRGDFDRITENETLRRVIRMTNSSGMPIALELLPTRMASVSDATGAARNVPPMFDATLTTVEPGEIYDLTVVGLPPFPEGRMGTAFNFKTGIPEYPTYLLNAHAYLPPRVEISPYRIVFNERAGATRRPITIRNNGT